MAGHNSVKMSDLVMLYKSLSYNDALTFIQSGNVIFSAEQSVEQTVIESEIEKSITEQFGYNIPVMIRTLEEMKKLVYTNPYLNEADFDPSKMAVTFLHDKPSGDQIKKVIDIDYPPDKFKVIGREIYTYCPNGFGKTKLYTNFFEKKMGVTGTARNWKSVTTIINLMEKE